LSQSFLFWSLDQPQEYLHHSGCHDVVAFGFAGGDSFLTGGAVDGAIILRGSNEGVILGITGNTVLPGFSSYGLGLFLFSVFLQY
jgi:hypothetical protein